MINYTELAELEARIDSKGKPLVVKFSAEWCGVCKMLAPIYARIADKLADKADFAELDTDAVPAAADKFDIMTLPTIMIFKNGETVHKSSGMLAESALTKLVEEAAN